MNLAARRSNPGFTLVELLIVIAVLAIGLTIAVPSFQEIIKRNQIAAQNNELIALVHLARNEAIRRNPVGDEYVLLELRNVDGTSGWTGAVYPPGDVETAEGCPTGAIRCATQTRGEFSGGDMEKIEIRFDNRGYSVDSASNLAPPVELTLSHVRCTSERHVREVTISRTGQVSSAQRSAGEGCP